jgi:CO/xanthine dehydrogenase FAD-binding subunit
MIEAYLRPKSADEAVKLLSETNKVRKPLAGGTTISRQQSNQFSVVDLQDSGLDFLDSTDRQLRIGSMVRLNTLVGHPEVYPEMKRAIKIDASENIRNAVTLGGWLITGDGHSILSTLLLALDATLIWEPGEKSVQIGDWLPLRTVEAPGVLLTAIELRKGIQIAFEYVARTPKDRAIVTVAAAQWGSGRTRIALGGYGPAPIIAMDGPESSGADAASRNALYKADDQWATGEYRREVAAKLALRCLERINKNKIGEV